jgi:polysaccharide export outer membrane protein
LIRYFVTLVCAEEGGHAPSARSGSIAALACIAFALSSCGSGIPKDGPAAGEFGGQAAVKIQPDQTLDYALVALSPANVKAANHSGTGGDPLFSAFARPAAPSQAPIAVGDILSVTIFEATPGGLFIPTDAGSRNGNFVTVPNEQVDSSGTLMTPYAGVLNVVGKTPQEVGKEIAARLVNKAIEPQVVVTIAERRSNNVSVLGDVNQPQRFSLDPGGIRLMAALARAGGPKDPAYESIVTVQRRGLTERALLSKVVKAASQNVELRAGDVVYVGHEPKTFMTLGATVAPGSVGGINNRRFSFDDETETLSQALAKSGGLDDTRADTKAVFIYRLESKRVLTEIGADASRFPGDLAPTIYSVDLSRPDGFFLTSAFYMKNNDFIFVSNALTPDLNKFLSTIGNVSAPTNSFSQAAAALNSIK